MAVKSITDENFANEVKKGIVLVDFWAEWCGPCRMVSPLIEELSTEMPQVAFAKLNIDENQETPQQLGITSIPTLLLYKDGELVDRVIGLQPKTQLTKLIQKYTN